MSIDKNWINLRNQLSNQYFNDDLNLIIQGIDREAVDIYRDWKYNLHKTYRNNVRISGVARARQQRSKAVQTMDQWLLTYDLFESEAYRVSEISNHNVFFHVIFFILKLSSLTFCLCITC